MKNCDKTKVVGEGVSRRTLTGGAVALLGFGPAMVRAEGGGEISRNAESIHQEPVFEASCARVYQALTDHNQFGKIVQLSGAMKAGELPADKPAQIDPRAGGAFSLFGGLISGRTIELVPNQRIVQAWRAGSWTAGAYSIVRFELVQIGSKTKIVFDHAGFPQGQADHLLAGWNLNYWEPMKKYFA